MIRLIVDLDPQLVQYLAPPLDRQTTPRIGRALPTALSDRSPST
jgi:hypothetical protein